MSDKPVENAVREDATPDVNVSAVQLRKKIRELTEQRDAALFELKGAQKKIEYLQSLEHQHAEAAKRADIAVNMLRRDMALIVEISRSNVRVDEYRRGG